ncbi:UDP-glucose dehydrogenase family protein [Alkalihalobacillus pseudalcaliphilus]|uniref:UDP-glucose dehydrogenase family protein n=1 Tax=Alkalihalobacillus pseudalcaliphilus TaxID=79884 RepID=UPI00064DE9F2|nr:UDP-glucose/GDP-mannose dehydrogenase family protein [Alkalihalobacillus pseudalcaliphilus]KMK77324.1 UDP-glucose 6-dehydrogenase [Alkalihalobacillus pseudalcaliphilus]
MNVCVIGAGYVGLTTSAVLADLGNYVYCVEINEQKLEKLKNGNTPIFEPQLENMIKVNLKSGRLLFSSSLSKAVNESSVIFIAVGTPSLSDGRTNLTFLESVINELSSCINSYKVIITKSTVPIGTNQKIVEELIKLGVSPLHFDIVSNPEFLREGSAIQDMLSPDKIVIGVNDHKPIELIQKLYKPFDAPFHITSLEGAEMIKYTANAFLATKISFINEISKICEVYNIDITKVAKGIGLDPRIGSHFLGAGLGYGGSCFPKDLEALIFLASQKQVSPHLLKATKTVNDSQVDFYIKKLLNKEPDLLNKKITVWGLSFKPNTDDIRESQAIKLIEHLSARGYDLHVHDPVVKTHIQNTTNYQHLYESIEQSDVLIIATEWDLYKNADWSIIAEKMNGTLIFDCRNCILPDLVTSRGLNYMGVARL